MHNILSTRIDDIKQIAKMYENMDSEQAALVLSK